MGVGFLDLGDLLFDEGRSLCQLISRTRSVVARIPYFDAQLSSIAGGDFEVC